MGEGEMLSFLFNLDRIYISVMMKGGESMRNYKIWFILVCFICGLLATLCGIFYYDRQEEKLTRLTAEIQVGWYKQDSEYYQQLYYDALHQYNDCQNTHSIWDKYLR
jgi:hypothetical protein